ncbi:MAG: hypothetical protein KGQ49_07425, partial [Verrucomicrobia bacterium]|nr:hypothetical protein [Verrucomicrobiota bacterium]
GRYLGFFSSSPRLLYPLCSTRFEIDISQIPKGSYRARVAFKSEEITVFSTEYAISVPEALDRKN